MQKKHIRSALLIAIVFLLPLKMSAAAESVLMPAKGDTCKAQAPQWESVGWRCPGPSGFSLVYSAGEEESGIAFGRSGFEKELTADVSWDGSTIDALGARAEWRMLDGRPFAAIVARWRAAGDGKIRSDALELLIVRVTERGDCAIAAIGAFRTGALAEARKVADERGPSFRCGVDKPSLAMDDKASNAGQLDGHFAFSELLDHNGSSVELTRSDQGLVEIRYREPRKSLQIQPNTLLFKGKDADGTLAGVAYEFKAGCSPAGYQVTGRRQNGVLVLEGAAPHRDRSSCRVVSTSTNSKNARLEFDFDPMLGVGLETGPVRSPDRADSILDQKGSAVAVDAILVANKTESGSVDEAHRIDPNGSDWKKGKLGHLSQYAGTYDYPAVLNDPEVARSLDTIAGAALAQKLKDYMSVMSPIALIGPDLVLKGNAEHQGGIKEATVWVSIYDGSVRGALLDESTVTIFAHDTNYEYLPEEFRNIVRRFGASARGDRSMDTLPQGVTWIRR
jgi:hypothetical protein